MRMLLFLGVLLGAAYLDLGLAGCPTRCNCSENAVTCISKSLEDIPNFESLNNNPVIVDLSGNSILLIDIDDFSFDKSEQVKEIYLNASNINTIEEKAFVELISLQEMYLAENLLNDILEDLFIYNENLILLDISRNLFLTMPKIKSKSLEVLAIANAEVQHIPRDTLEELPNLRILLLQQNNLKYIQPLIFENMHSLFFVKLSYNPWRCDCKTIRLFNYLVERGFTDLTEPVQCLNDDKDFFNIYNLNGIEPAFQDRCINSVTENEDLFEVTDPPVEVLPLQSTVNSPTVTIKQHTFSETDLVFYSMIFIAIPLSLLLGVVFGSCITYRYMIISLKRSRTDSSKELLKK